MHFSSSPAAREEHSDLACRKSYPLRLLCSCIGSSTSYQDSLSVLLVDSFLSVNVPTLPTQIKNIKTHSLDYLSGKPALSICFLGLFIFVFFFPTFVSYSSQVRLLLLKELEEKTITHIRATSLSLLHSLQSVLFCLCLWYKVHIAEIGKSIKMKETNKHRHTHFFGGKLSVTRWCH